MKSKNSLIISIGHKSNSGYCTYIAHITEENSLWMMLMSFVCNKMPENFEKALKSMADMEIKKNAIFACADKLNKVFDDPVALEKLLDKIRPTGKEKYKEDAKVRDEIYKFLEKNRNATLSDLAKSFPGMNNKRLTGFLVAFKKKNKKNFLQ